MQFINAVVSTPADDVDFKIHLRNEFMRCGLGQVLPVNHACFYGVAQFIVHNVIRHCTRFSTEIC